MGQGTLISEQPWKKSAVKNEGLDFAVQATSHGIATWTGSHQNSWWSHLV